MCLYKAIKNQEWHKRRQKQKLENKPLSEGKDNVGLFEARKNYLLLLQTQKNRC